MKPSHTFIFLETSGSKIKHGVCVRQLISIDKYSFREMGEKNLHSHLYREGENTRGNQAAVQH